MLNILILPRNFSQSVGFSAPNLVFLEECLLYFSISSRFFDRLNLGWGNSLQDQCHDATDFVLRLLSIVFCTKV